MEINKSPEILHRINELLDAKEINISVADFLFDLFNYPLDKIPTIDNIFDEYNFSKNDKKLVKSRINCIKAVSTDSIKNNDYFSSIKFPSIKIGDYEFSYDVYQKYEIFSNDEILLNQSYENIYELGFFEQQMKLPCLRKNGNIWMSITPNEINTMRDSIQKAEGDVLVIGLGIGYYAYMISNKENVKSITIIENDKQIISLFKNYLLKQFKNKNKITIIENEAFDFLSKTKEKYDYAFVDIWHNPEDGLPLYIKFHKNMSSLPLKTDYWLERSIIDMFRRYVLTIIEESLRGYKEKDYKLIKHPEDEIINNIYMLTKKYSIQSIQDLEQLLSENYLLSLIKKL